MKKYLSVFMFVGFSFNTAFAATERCKAQQDELTVKLTQARQTGNAEAERSLATALDKVNTYCTEARQQRRAKHALEKKQRLVIKETLDLDEVRAELIEAKLDGEQRKIQKYERKIKEKTTDLEVAKTELAEAEANYQRLMGEK